jgi:ABC-2 type transport system permease protein
VSPRTWVIAKREFLATVTRKGYLFTLVLMPLWISFAFSMGSLPAMMSRGGKGSEAARYVGIVDQAGILALVPGESDSMSREQAIVAREENEDVKKARLFIVRPYGSVEKAQAAFTKDEISGFLVVPADYLQSGKLDEYRRSGGIFARVSAPPWRVWLRERLLAGRIDPLLVTRVLEPGETSTHVPDDRGGFKIFHQEDELGSFLVPFGFAMLLFTTMFTSAGYLLQGLGEEKESRILESLLSSVTADELMRGKLFGIGAAGLLMGLTWGTIGLNAILALAPVFLPPTSTLVLLFFYFILGYTMFGALALGLGSLVNSYQEATTISAILSFTAVLPMMFGLSFMTEQGSSHPLARILSMFPITAPISMAMRLSQGNVPAWEIAVSLGLLALAGWFVMRMASRVFRVALLLYGKTWNLPEIMRWVGKA